jgi:hypothetical protein
VLDAYLKRAAGGEQDGNEHKAQDGSILMHLAGHTNNLPQKCEHPRDDEKKRQLMVETATRQAKIEVFWAKGCRIFV